MRQHDKLIGKLVYGWTEEETRHNPYFNEFFGIWMPKPKDKDTLYPSWSTSGKWAMRLIEDLIAAGIDINLGQSDVGYKVTISHSLFESTGTGSSIPEALGHAFSHIDNFYLAAVDTVSIVKIVLEEHT